ncbi:MAG: hypothetical protein HY512_03175 [Candidatus Aenigmarchaeota archaeon]|nr:hypothetical protein [Candidatus Aenigmarchaeota archaeon]
MSKAWRKIFVGEEVPFNDLSAEDVQTLKSMGVYSLKIRVDLTREDAERLPTLANKYNDRLNPGILDSCFIVGAYNSREEQEKDHTADKKVFEFDYKSTTVFL